MPWPIREADMASGSLLPSRSWRCTAAAFGWCRRRAKDRRFRWSSPRAPNFASLRRGAWARNGCTNGAVELQAKRKAPSWGWAPSNMPPRVRWRRRSNNEIARQLFQLRRRYPQRNVFWTPNSSSKCPRADSPDALALIPAVTSRSGTPSRRASSRKPCQPCRELVGC